MIDMEEYLLGIQTYIQNNLNTAITDINTEKSDSITLQTVSSAAYFLQTLNDTVANYNPYILIALSDIQGSGIGPGTVKTLIFEAILVLEDRGQDLMIGQRMLRYLKAFERIFHSGFNKVFPHAIFKVNSLVPIAITSVNSNDPFRAVGVELVTTLG